MKLRALLFLVLLSFGFYAIGLDKLLKNNSEIVFCFEKDADDSQKDSSEEKDIDDNEKTFVEYIAYEHLSTTAIVNPKGKLTEKSSFLFSDYLLDVVSPPPEA